MQRSEKPERTWSPRLRWKESGRWKVCDGELDVLFWSSTPRPTAFIEIPKRTPRPLPLTLFDGRRGQKQRYTGLRKLCEVDEILECLLGSLLIIGVLVLLHLRSCESAIAIAMLPRSSYKKMRRSKNRRSGSHNLFQNGTAIEGTLTLKTRRQHESLARKNQSRYAAPPSNALGIGSRETLCSPLP
jgi:hypothetical protein